MEGGLLFIAEGGEGQVGVVGDVFFGLGEEAAVDVIFEEAEHAVEESAQSWAGNRHAAGAGAEAVALLFDVFVVVGERVAELEDDFGAAFGDVGFVRDDGGFFADDLAEVFGELLGGQVVSVRDDGELRFAVYSEDEGTGFCLGQEAGSAQGHEGGCDD